MLTFLLILIGIGVSFYLSTELSKPLSNLVKGTIEIKKGNFLHRIEPFSNDELGDLTSAFNDMSDGLRKKEIIQDAFGRYVTPEIVDMILQHPDEKWLRGKKIDITVMFADIRGFTAFSEKTEPEEVVNVLNDHFTLATEVILRHGGHVDKFIGDEILAVFGALVHSEDHASKAVTAAVALQKELNDFNLTMEGAGRMPVRIGIGINSGSAIAGNIGSNKRMEYTVIGDAVNLASRLTRVAGPDEIIISDHVYEKTSKIITAEKLEPVTVKGKSEPVQIYKVTGINPLNV
jgi:adenylate cyclase